MAEDIPDKIRQLIYDRDLLACRMCGRGVLGVFDAGIHHIIFGGSDRGMGGARVHNPDEMVLLCGDCHRRAHQDKRRWQYLLLETVKRGGVTAFQLARWERSRQLKRRRQRLS